MNVIPIVAFLAFLVTSDPSAKVDSNASRYLPIDASKVVNLGPRGSRGLACSPDGKTLVLFDVRDEILELPSGKRLFKGELLPKGEHAAVISFSPSGKSLMVGSLDGVLYKLDLSEPESPKRSWQISPDHMDDLTAVAVAPDESFVLTTSPKEINTWQMTDGKMIEKHRTRTTSYHFNWCALAFPAASDECFYFEQTYLYRITFHPMEVVEQKLIPNRRSSDRYFRPTFSPSSRYVAALTKSGIHRWDREQKTTFPTLTMGGQAYSLAFADEGKLLISGHYGRVNFWSMEDSRLVESYELKERIGSAGKIHSLAVSSLGYVVAGDDKMSLHLVPLPEVAKN